MRESPPGACAAPSAAAAAASRLASAAPAGPAGASAAEQVLRARSMLEEGQASVGILLVGSRHAVDLCGYEQNIENNTSGRSTPGHSSRKLCRE